MLVMTNIYINLKLIQFIILKHFSPNNEPWSTFPKSHCYNLMPSLLHNVPGQMSRQVFIGYEWILCSEIEPANVML